MMGWKMRLGGLVFAILLTTCPEKVELPMGNLVLEPVVVHVKFPKALHVNLGRENFMVMELSVLMGFQVKSWVTLFRMDLKDGNSFLCTREYCTSLIF